MTHEKNTSNLYPETGWGRRPEDSLIQRASYDELRWLESRGVDVVDLDGADERRARDVRSAERQLGRDPVAQFEGQVAVNHSLASRS